MWTMPQSYVSPSYVEYADQAAWWSPLYILLFLTFSMWYCPNSSPSWSPFFKWPPAHLFPRRIWDSKCRTIPHALPQECHLLSLTVGYNEEMNESYSPCLCAQNRGEKMVPGITLACVCISTLLVIILRLCTSSSALINLVFSSVKWM